METAAISRWQRRRIAFDQLFSAATRSRLLLALLGSVGVAFAEVLGVAALLPLMQILTGARTDVGFLGWLSERLGHPSETTLAVSVSAIVFSAFVIKGLATIAFRWWLLGFINQQEVTTSVAMLGRYLSAPYWLHLQRNTSSLLRTMSEAVSQTYSGVVVGVIGVVTEIATLTGVLLALLVIMPVPTLVAAAYFGGAGYGLQRWARSRSESAGSRLMDSSSLTYQAAIQALGGVKEIKVRRKADHFLDDYQRARQDLGDAKRVMSFLGEFPRYVLELVFTVGVAVMTVASFLVSSSGQGLTVLALFVAAGFRLLPSMVRMVASLNSARAGRRGLALVLADLAEISGEPAATDDGGSLAIHREIRVTDLSFHYNGSEATVLNRVNFDIPVGSSLAIVGSSGAGKSTLVDLLLGLHGPAQGQITVDGANITEVLPQWQRSIGLVPQEVYLLDDTMRANIAFGEREAEIDPVRIADAVSLAQLDDVIADLPDGLETFVGERGVRLSGGQRQRIGIARALYLRPQLLVLDEATSALDNETERRITETIDHLHGRLTLVVVAHRLTTVRRCDRLLFLNNGVAEALGSFDEVRDRSAAFARLVELGTLDGVAGPMDEGVSA